MSRDGPAHRQAELLPDNKEPQHQSFRTTFTRLFEAGDDTLALAKRDMFRTPGEFVESVLQKVSAYCAPLKQLLWDLHSALVSALKSHSSGGLYGKIIAAFTAAEVKVTQLPADFTAQYFDLKMAEAKHRAKDNQGHWDVYSPHEKHGCYLWNAECSNGE